MYEVIEAVNALESVLDSPTPPLSESQRSAVAAALAALVDVRQRLEQDFVARPPAAPIGTVLLMEIDQGNAVTEMDGRRRYWRSITDASEGNRLVGWLETTDVAANDWLHKLLDGRIGGPQYRAGRHNKAVPI